MWAVEFGRWFLAAFFLFVAAFYTVRIIAVTRRRGRSPVFVGRPGTWHYATHLSFRVFRVLILAVCVVRVPFPEIDAALIPIRPLWHPAVLLTGNALLAGSFAWVIYTHFYMAEHWKSGTPPGNGSRLITSGPFGRSRNPMLLGVQIAQLGLFLSLPSAFTLVCLAVGLWAVHVQVRVEERLLAERWGNAYAAYRAHTPRWL